MSHNSQSPFARGTKIHNMLLCQATINLCATSCLALKTNPTDSALTRKSKANFGVSTAMIKFIWNCLVKDELLPNGAQVHHLLWTLAFLKTYETEQVYSSRFRTSEKTFRTWVWKLILAISRLNQVRFHLLKVDCSEY